MASTTPDPVIAEARKRWTKCADAEADQRARILAGEAISRGRPVARRHQARAGRGAEPRGGARPTAAPVPRRRPALAACAADVSNTIKNADFGLRCDAEWRRRGHGDGRDLSRATCGACRTMRAAIARRVGRGPGDRGRHRLVPAAHGIRAYELGRRPERPRGVRPGTAASSASRTT